MPESCNILIDLANPFDQVILIDIIVAAAFIFYFYSISKGFKDLLGKIPHIFGLIGLFLLFNLLLFIWLLFSLEAWNNPISSNYAQMHAAIKNTCLLDPERKNCPKNLTELMSLYPEDFKRVTQKSTIHYEYYPESNTYTLIGYENNTRKGAIFDPRLKNVPGFGNDFADFRFYTCKGEKRIDNIPPFDGLWNRI